MPLVFFFDEAAMVLQQYESISETKYALRTCHSFFPCPGQGFCFPVSGWLARGDGEAEGGGAEKIAAPNRPQGGSLGPARVGRSGQRVTA